MSQSNIIKIGSYSYSDLDVIGKGSFGKVYKGKSLKTGGIVAIKVIYVESNKQSSLIRMIKNEVEALKKSKSEHIVQFFDFIVQNNNVYIITELCNQKDLRHYLAKHKILEEKKAVEFLKQIVSAFKELCRRQVFHRDLKPANVLLHNGICKIADFGFAKTLDFSVTDYNTHMVSIVGTPLYMSPQLLDKQKYTTKSDIWSLGIIFYEMLFGRVPWVGKDPATYSKNIKSQPLTIIHDVNPISAEAEDFICQCLKVSEEERIGWNELFNHPLINNETSSARSTKEDSKAEDFAEFLTAESRIKSYSKGPVNPSSLMKLYQNKALSASRAVTASQLELTKTTIDQKLKYISHFGFSQSILGRGNATTTPHSRTFNMSVNEDAKSNHEHAYGRLRSNGPLLKDSREISPSPDARGKNDKLTKQQSDEIQEEFRKIERPLVIMKNKLIVLSDLHGTVTQSEEFKELPAIKFNFLITISKLINVIFKNLASQVLTRKVKTRSHLLQDYLDTDKFKRIVVFVETNKKKYEEMLKNCSRKLFELNLPSDKEKDEVLDYYQDTLNESEEQVLLGKLVDVANQMLYQIRFSSQIYRKSVAAGTNQYIESYNPAVTKEYFEGLLAIFGEESIIDTFKYDKIDEILSKVERLKEESKHK